MDSVTADVDRAVAPSCLRSSRSAPLLVGRALEQIYLREELAAVLAGRGRLVLLGGEAGIGKTTLARDLAAEAEARGIRVLDGACYDLTNTPPYGPWLDLFDNAALDRNLPSPTAAFAGGRLARVTDRAALFTEARAFFAGLAAAGPALLLLEDLHWADPASLELLRHLAPRLRHWPILLLVSYRGDELTRRHPFAAQLPALVREADGLRLDLRRLDEAALGDLVAARYHLSGADRLRLVAYLDRHAEGNALFTTELLRALEEEALLSPGDDGWTLGELDHVVVPAFLLQVIESRIARLGEAMRQPLAIAAVIGQEVPLALWAEVADLDYDVLLTITERAVDTHLLEANPDGQRVRFVHALTREALFAGILPPRRRLWHRRVGEALAASSRPNPDAVAYHLQAAGDPRAWEWLVEAGDRAQHAYDWLTAAARLRAAAAMLEDVEGQERTRGRLACHVAYLTRFSDPAAAIRGIDTAADIAAQIGDAVMAAEARWVRGLLLCYLDRFQPGLAEMVTGIEALEATSSDPARVPATLQAWIAGALPATGANHGTGDEWEATHLGAAKSMDWRGVSLGRFLASAGYLRTAIEDCGRLAAVLPGLPEGSGRLRAFAAFNAHGLGVAQAGLGCPDEARVAFAQARADFADLGHHGMVAFTLLNELVDVTLTYGAADPAARRRIAAEAEVALDRAGGALRPGISPRLVWLRCLVLNGRWDEADRILRDLPTPGNAYLRREMTAVQVMLARHRGQPGRAWVEIRGLLQDGPETEPGGVIHQEGLFLQRLAAELCLDSGDVVAAHAWLVAHDRWLAWSGSVLGLADGRIAWARYHREAGDLVLAHATAADALVLATELDQPLVRLAAHRLLGEIVTAAKNLAVAEEHLTAALDLAAACRTPFERALTLLSLVDLRLAAGLTDEAASLLDKVRDICGPLGAAPTLARVDALAQRLALEPGSPPYPAGLTQREVEILRLLPRGLSTPEIAETLFISPRTVQTHLTNLYAKLGVGGRAEAIVFAVSRGLA